MAKKKKQLIIIVKIDNELQSSTFYPIEIGHETMENIKRELIKNKNLEPLITALQHDITDEAKTKMQPILDRLKNGVENGNVQAIGLVDIIGNVPLCWECPSKEVVPLLKTIHVTVAFSI